MLVVIAAIPGDAAVAVRTVVPDPASRSARRRALERVVTGPDRDAGVDTGGCDDTTRQAVTGAPLFVGVDPSAMVEVMKQLHPVQFSPRQRIYDEGETGDRLYIVVTGKVKIGRRRPDGRRLLLGVVGPSEVFGELSVFDPGVRTANATALTAVTAMAMDREVLQGWLALHPEIAERMLRVLARRLRRTDHDLSDLIFTDVAGRVATALLRLAQRFGVQRDGAMLVEHDLTQDEIAQLVGSSRESINKVLTDFTTRGWIRVDGKAILIVESERLLRRSRVGSV